MQNAIRRLMGPDDMLETFSELAVKRQRRHTMSEIRGACALLVNTLQVGIVTDWRTVWERRTNCQIHLSCGTTEFLPCPPKWNLSSEPFVGFSRRILSAEPLRP